MKNLGPRKPGNVYAGLGQFTQNRTDVCSYDFRDCFITKINHNDNEPFISDLELDSDLLYRQVYNKVVLNLGIQRLNSEMSPILRTLVRQ